MKLLLVEDDESLADWIMTALSEQHYAVDMTSDGQSVMDFVETYPYDLILLDINLPGMNGIQICQRLRDQDYHMPILLLTARDRTEDKVAGLDAGADDFVVKPVAIAELSARIRSLVRRGSAEVQTQLTWGDLTLDPNSFEVTFRTDSVDLTPKEYSLLDLLLRNPKRVYSHSAILDHLWVSEDSPGTDTVRAHVKKLDRN